MTMSKQMMNENVMTNNEITSPAPYFWYNHPRKKIVGKELNFRKSGNPGSAQDKALMCAKKEHPDYGYEIIKPKKEKKSYKGLKRELMFDYIDCFGSKEMMEQLQKMKEDGTGFPAMKSWFLDLFPKFNVEKAIKEVQKHRLGKVKAKYRPVKLHTKATSNNELPKASGQ